MILDAVQKRIVEGKPLRSYLVKGSRSTGKTISALHRAVYLKNNYCLYEDDRILVLSSDEYEKDKVVKKYKAIEKESGFNYITLFSSTRECVTVNTLQQVIKDCYDGKVMNGGKPFNLLDTEQKRTVLEQCIIEHKNTYKHSKLLKSEYIDFFLNEIKWIKCCNYKSLEDYQRANRVGVINTGIKSPRSVSRNSALREMIYKLMTLYNNKLMELQLMDEEDLIKIALDGVKDHKGNLLYTHIIVDDSQRLSKLQLDFIEALVSSRTYSSVMYIINKSNFIEANAWFIKGRSSKSYGLNLAKKSYSLTRLYCIESEEVPVSNNCLSDGVKETSRTKECGQSNMSVEKFEYYDLRYRKGFDFIRDSSRTDEIVVSHEESFDEYKAEELRELSVYNDIAAGEPIAINSQQEDSFYLPKLWIKSNHCFILKVKGDSMINANIEDGDYVVIRKQSMAQHNDIVAADINGSATLKRLNIRKHSVLLMPENEKYSPIPIMEEGASILGIAVGVIKNKNS